MSEEEKPNCPKCGSSSAMVLHDDEWVCHATHPIEYIDNPPSNTIHQILERLKRERELDIPDEFDEYEQEERGASATLNFPLPECEFEFRAATNALRLSGTLSDIDNLCRSVMKYDSITDIYELAEQIRYEINEVRNLIE